MLECVFDLLEASSKAVAARFDRFSIGSERALSVWEKPTSANLDSNSEWCRPAAVWMMTV
jgi:hypothetical protein